MSGSCGDGGDENNRTDKKTAVASKLSTRENISAPSKRVSASRLDGRQPSQVLSSEKRKKLQRKCRLREVDALMMVMMHY